MEFVKSWIESTDCIVEKKKYIKLALKIKVINKAQFKDLINSL